MQLHLLSLSRLGDSRHLSDFLSQIGDLDKSHWGFTLIKLTLGLADPKVVIEQARDELQCCQARYYAGARCMTLGNASDAKREWEECISLRVDCLERSLARVECGDESLACFGDPGDETSERIALLNRQSWLLNSSGRVSEARTFAAAAVEMGRNLLGEQHPRFASSLHVLALIHESMGDWIESQRLYRQTIEIRRAALGEDHPNYAVALKNYARCLTSMGNYSEAENVYRQARVAIAQSLGDTSAEYDECLFGMASLYDDMGRYGEAESLYREDVEVSLKVWGENHPSHASTLSNLGLLYLNINDKEAAESTLEQALAICESQVVQDTRLMGSVLNNLGLLHQASGTVRNDIRAEDYYKRSLELTRSSIGADSLEYGINLDNLASLYTATGDHQKAEDCYRQSETILRGRLGGAHPDYATSLNNLAMLRSQCGDNAEAERLLRQVVEIRRTALGDRHIHTAQALTELGVSIAAQRRERESLDVLKEANRIFTDTIIQIGEFASGRQAAEFRNSVQYSFKILLSLVLRSFASNQTVVCEAFDMLLARKALGIDVGAALRDPINVGDDPILTQKLKELNELGWTIARKILSGQGPENEEAHQKLLGDLEARRERLEADLARTIPQAGLARLLRTSTRADVCRSLPEGTVLVEFFRTTIRCFEAVESRGESAWGPSRYLAFVVGHGGADSVRMVDLGEAEKIEDGITAFRRSITGEETELPNRGLYFSENVRESKLQETGGPALRASVFDRIVSESEGCTKLILSPDGALSLLPFEVLPEDHGGHLIDRYSISYVSSARDIIRFGIRSSRQPGDCLVVAAPDFNLGMNESASVRSQRGALYDRTSDEGGWWHRFFRLFSPKTTSVTSETMPSPEELGPARSGMKTLHFSALPGARDEGLLGGQILGVWPWVGAEVEEGLLKAIRSPRILHIATHGYFLADPLAGYQWKGVGPRPVGPRLSGLLPQNPLLRCGLALAGANTWLRNRMSIDEVENGLLNGEDVAGMDPGRDGTRRALGMRHGLGRYSFRGRCVWATPRICARWGKDAGHQPVEDSGPGDMRVDGGVL